MNGGSLDGRLLVAGRRVEGTGGSLVAEDRRTGAALEPSFDLAAAEQVDLAARAAGDAADALRASDPAARAALLEAIAGGLERRGGELVQRAAHETALTVPRLEGELARTTGQLRAFAALLRDPSSSGARYDRGAASGADLAQRRVGVGPVAVFGASNFPLAFSTAGGDTAAALAAGCPVVVKSHEAHPGTAAIAADAVTEAVRDLGMPEGTFSAVLGEGPVAGQALAAHPAIRAIGFTGSRRAGLALLATAQSRPVPIPVFAEMSSINPVVVLPGALRAETAEGFVASLILGAGQFCTNPGLLLVPRGTDGDRFVEGVAERLGRAPAETMLTPAIAAAYRDGVAGLERSARARTVARGQEGGTSAPAAGLFEVDAAALIEEPALQEEVFGAAAVIARYDDDAQLRRVLDALEGQLTATVHAAPDELDAVRELLPALERLAGRIILNGWPTGVAVSPAMVHGGPWPATSDGRSTSVGTAAIERFQRPIAYQGLPAELLPSDLREAASTVRPAD